jgi:hypothetical protein
MCYTGVRTAFCLFPLAPSPNTEFDLIYAHELDNHLATKHSTHTNPSMPRVDQFILTERGLYQAVLGKWIRLIGKQIVKIGFICRFFYRYRKIRTYRWYGSYCFSSIHRISSKRDSPVRSWTPEQEGKPPSSSQSVAYSPTCCKAHNRQGTQQCTENVDKIPDVSMGKYAQLCLTILTYIVTTEVSKTATKTVARARHTASRKMHKLWQEVDQGKWQRRVQESEDYQHTPTHHSKQKRQSRSSAGKKLN